LRLAYAAQVGVSASCLLRGLCTPVIAKPGEAVPAPPPTMMPVALRAERRVAAPLLIAPAAPVAVVPVFPAVPVATPAAPVAEAKPVVASVTPEITAPPPAPPVERKVAAPSNMPAAAINLPALKPDFFPARMIEPAAPVAETKPVIVVAVPAVPASAATPKIVAPAAFSAGARAVEPPLAKPPVARSVALAPAQGG
jgi:hypothetical protein